MRKGYEALGVILAITAWMIGPPRCQSQEPVPVHMVVTAEAHRGPDVPEIHKEDVQVYGGVNAGRLPTGRPFEERPAHCSSLFCWTIPAIQMWPLSLEKSKVSSNHNRRPLQSESAICGTEPWISRRT